MSATYWPDVLGVLDDHLEHVHGIALVEEALRLGQRHEDHAAVELGHAHLVERSDLVGLDARRGAEGRRGAPRRHQGDAVADVDAQELREAHADGDAVLAVEAVQSTGTDVLGDQRQRLQALLAQAAHLAAERLRGRGRDDLSLDQGHGVLDAGDSLQSLGHIGVVRKVVAADLVDDDMSVEPENLVEQLLAEAVHHRHHDDERRHAEQDAEKREAGDDRDEPFLAAGAQIAQSQHPLERGERPGVGGWRGHVPKASRNVPLGRVRPKCAGRRSARPAASPPHRASGSHARPTCAPSPRLRRSSGPWGPR